MATPLVTRPKILCLGVSYADIAATKGYNTADYSVNTTTANNTAPRLETERNDAFFDKPLTADDALRCVEDKVLNQMDGRDLTRILATEALCQVDVYCVSQEKGAIYRQDRHLDANFNRSSFVKKLQKAFSECIQFDQIILDYFWIPTGWDVHHWSMNFFESVLISFAKAKLISPSSAITTTALNGLYRTGIYLPFCFHCFQAIVAYAAKLTTFYNISFIRKNELQCVTLWAGTQTINKQRMQHVLGKRIDQEEVYCTFTERHIKEMSFSGTGVSKEELTTVAMSLEGFPDIRFIVLEPLQILDQSHPQYVCGRFLGLTSSPSVQHGLRSGERLPSFWPNQSVRSTKTKSLAPVSSLSSSGLSAARKQKLSNSPNSSNSPRKSPRLDLLRQSPNSVTSISLQSNSLRPKVLFPSTGR